MEENKITVILRVFYGDQAIKEHRDIPITDAESNIHSRIDSQLQFFIRKGYITFRNMILPWHAVKEIAILE